VAVCLAVVFVAAIAWLPLSYQIKNVAFWRPVTSIVACAMPFLLYLALALAVIALINLAWSTGQVVTGTGHLTLKALLASSRMQFVRAATVFAVILALGVTGFGYHKAHNPAITTTSVSFPHLPTQFDGFRIALLADIHVGIGLGRSFVEGIVERVNAEEPDLIVIAGDLSNGSPEQLGDDLEPLEKLHADFGVLVTTGNHEFDADASKWISWLNARGLPVLDNAGVVLTRGQASIDVLGINDRMGKAPHEPDLEKAVQQLHKTFGVPVDGSKRFRVLIAHQPVQVFGQDNLASKIGVDLMLSAHTHGGQFWPIRYLVKAQQPVLQGTNVLDGVTVVTTRGAGAWGPPARVGAPPEIPIITLIRG